ncbi:MAG: class I tRNA ligase family protein, partial [Phycisphaerales bacterium]
WYLEWAKPRMQDEKDKPIAQNVLAFVLDQTLPLLHPFVPFITEGIFQKLNEIAPARGLKGLVEAKESEALVTAQWASQTDTLADSDAEHQIEIVQTVIRSVRDIRSSRNIAQKDLLVVSAKSHRENVEILNGNSGLIRQLAGIKKFEAATDVAKPADAAVAVADSIEVYVHNVVDNEAERARLEKQKAQVEKAKSAVEAKLANGNFVSRAKPEVVAGARQKLGELTEQLGTVEKHLSELNG